jgi:hypothetical protein
MKADGVAGAIEGSGTGDVEVVRRSARVKAIGGIRPFRGTEAPQRQREHLASPLRDDGMGFRQRGSLEKRRAFPPCRALIQYLPSRGYETNLHPRKGPTLLFIYGSHPHLPIPHPA